MQSTRHNESTNMESELPLPKQIACIVCKHVAHYGTPILQAQRDESVDPADSGWQFLCGTNSHLDVDAEIWSTEEVCQRDPSIKLILERPVGTKLTRQSAESEWHST